MLLACLVLGSSLLTGGVLEALRDGPLSTHQDASDPTRLDGPVMIYVDGLPVVRVEEGRVEVLGEWQPAAMQIQLEPADAATCPAAHVVSA